MDATYLFYALAFGGAGFLAARVVSRRRRTREARERAARIERVDGYSYSDSDRGTVTGSNSDRDRDGNGAGFYLAQHRKSGSGTVHGPHGRRRAAVDGSHGFIRLPDETPLGGWPSDRR